MPIECFFFPFLFLSCCHSVGHRVVSIISGGCNQSSCNITDGRCHEIAVFSRLKNIRAHQLSSVIGYKGLTIKVTNLAHAGRVT